ncbi:MAG: DUF952 domain-containing protein [Rhodomicrobium sp.]
MSGLMPERTIHKIMTKAEWEAARASGVYRGSAHDLRDGFIHFSTAAQLAGTARKYFSGVPGLVLLAVDVAVLNQPRSPHPVPLPLGEGTLAPGVVQASRLPWGEGQDEGCALLRWELSRGGDLFPHLYGDLPIAAVKSVTALPLAEDGIPILPGNVAS